jgi:hypothetical protein
VAAPAAAAARSDEGRKKLAVLVLKTDDAGVGDELADNLTEVLIATLKNPGRAAAWRTSAVSAGWG